MFEMLTSHSIRLLWLYENTHTVYGTDRSDERNLLLGDSSVFASLYPAIIYSTRCQILSVPPFKLKFLQITCLFCNCKALQLPDAMKVVIITSMPLKLQPQRRFYGLKTFAGQWTIRSVDTGALFYVACSLLAILRFVSLTYTQLYFHR